MCKATNQRSLQPFRLVVVFWWYLAVFPWRDSGGDVMCCNVKWFGYEVRWDKVVGCEVSCRATWCDVMGCDVMMSRGVVLHHAMRCDGMWCNAMWCGVLSFHATSGDANLMRCDVMWHDVMWCDVISMHLTWSDAMHWDRMQCDRTGCNWIECDVMRLWCNLLVLFGCYMRLCCVMQRGCVIWWVGRWCTVN